MYFDQLKLRAAAWELQETKDMLLFIKGTSLQGCQSSALRLGTFYGY